MRWGMGVWEEPRGVAALWTLLSLLIVQKVREACPFRFCGHMSAKLLALVVILTFDTCTLFGGLV